jgi:hypothetical protein
MTKSPEGSVFNQAVFMGFMAMACVTCLYLLYFA